MKLGTVLLALALCSAARAELSADDQKAVQQVRNVFHVELSSEHRAVEHPAAFPGVAVVAQFAYDRGYAPGWVVRGSEAWKLESAARPVLQAAGWPAADAAARQALAQSWVEQVVLAWGDLPLQEPAAFRGQTEHKWSALSSRSLPDGGVQVDAWVQDPTGMVPRNYYSQHRWTFDAQGATHGQVLDSWSVPIPGAHR